MLSTFWTALGTSLMAAVVTSLGIYTIRRFADWGQRNTAYFMCFAAGVLIAASFLHIIPESFAMNPQAPSWLLVGFLGLHLFNRFLTAFVCERARLCRRDPSVAPSRAGAAPLQPGRTGRRCAGGGHHCAVQGVRGGPPGWTSARPRWRGCIEAYFETLGTPGRRTEDGLG